MLLVGTKLILVTHLSGEMNEGFAWIVEEKSKENR